jgi:hypothetical protein
MTTPNVVMFKCGAGYLSKLCHRCVTHVCERLRNKIRRQTVKILQSYSNRGINIQVPLIGKVYCMTETKVTCVFRASASIFVTIWISLRHSVVKHV